MISETDIRRIRALILDVDGVLTDGRIGYGSQEGEIKFFDVKDGHALVLLRRVGLKAGILSGRASAANRQRAAELRLDFIYEGELDKRAGFERLLQEQELTAAECLYVGDDLVDLPVMRQAGIAVAVADAVPEVRQQADWVTEAGGGRGAIREVVVWLLQQQGTWETATARYYQEAGAPLPQQPQPGSGP